MLQMGELKRKAQISFKNSEISSCILQKLMRYLGLVGVPPSLYTHSFTQATFTTAALTLPRSSCNWYAEWTTIVVCRGGWRYRTPQNTRWGLTSNTDITLGTQPAVPIQGQSAENTANTQSVPKMAQLAFWATTYRQPWCVLSAFFSGLFSGVWEGLMIAVIIFTSYNFYIYI